MMGTDQVDSKSLLPEDLEKLQGEDHNEAREAVKKELTKSTLERTTGIIGKAVDAIGETVAIITLLFLITVMVRSRIRRRAQATPIVTAILMMSTLVGAAEHLIEYCMSKEAANIDIPHH